MIQCTPLRANHRLLPGVACFMAAPMNTVPMNTAPMNPSALDAALPPGSRLRQATDADGTAIGRLIASIFAEYPGCSFTAREFPELTAIASHFSAQGGRVWVVEMADADAPPAATHGARDLIACCAIAPTRMPAVFELTKVYVDKSWRGSGLAQRLIAVALDLACTRGAKRVELFSDTRFLAAHRFYRKLGFTPIPGERYLADISQSWEYHFAYDIARRR